MAKRKAPDDSDPLSPRMISELNGKKSKCILDEKVDSPEQIAQRKIYKVAGLKKTPEKETKEADSKTKNLFGSAPATKDYLANSEGSVFSSKADPPKSIFGNIKPTTSGGLFGSKPATNIFGNAPSGENILKNAEASVFSKKVEEPKKSAEKEDEKKSDKKVEEKKSIFGGMFGSSATAAPGGLFGTSSTSGGLFGTSTLFPSTSNPFASFANNSSSNWSFLKPKEKEESGDEEPEKAEGDDNEFFKDKNGEKTGPSSKIEVKEVEKSPYTKLISLRVEKIKVADSSKKDGVLSIEYAQNEKDNKVVVMLIFRSPSGRVMFQGTISHTISRWRKFDSGKGYKVQRIITVIGEKEAKEEGKAAEKKMGVIEVKVSFSHEKDAQEFRTKFIEAKKIESGEKKIEIPKSPKK
eukprot:TRINITY_DN8992_c0_g1_i1.p1 TRINITY_DN8992_c0_g1~~TRINITY_DN8992_c0_g1_i1.p1  ORF type:complete len:409 (-),score=81.69 TRINITY_DN8992_c0_g1_i1:37-1263(-)